jgi:tripeptide aminopeptidase
MDSTTRKFLDLVAIDSVTDDESAIARVLADQLADLGLSPVHDEAGNLYARLAGTGDRILLNAHMDTVPAAKGAKAVVEGNVVRTDGSTALGADDKAAIAAILTVLGKLVSTGSSHRDIVVLLTVGEEAALKGAARLDRSLLSGIDYGYTFDASGPVGTCITAAPGYDRIRATFHGKASHAGFDPEQGISAIQMGSRAISAMHLLKIEEGVTANIGSFVATGSDNVVCDRAVLSFESRGLDRQKHARQTDHMVDCLRRAAAEAGGTVDIETEHLFSGYVHDRKMPAFVRLASVCNGLGLPYRQSPTMGGSDANRLNEMGIPTVVCSSGYEQPHSVSEHIAIEEIDKLERLVYALTTR